MKSSAEQGICRGFLCAARQGNVKQVRAYLSSYRPFHRGEWPNGYVLLREALANGHDSVADLLLDAGARVNNKSGNPTNTPLHYAIECGFKDVVQRLLFEDARVNDKNKDGFTPLHYAAREKNVEIVKLLLNYDALVDASDNAGTTALHISVRKRNFPITQILLNHGASVHCTRGYIGKYTPLHEAAELGSEEICKLLLSKGASVNALSTHIGTPLHVAIVNKRLNIFKLLLENGADTIAHEGQTCLHLAARSGSVDVVQVLLNKGISVDVRNSQRATPAFLAAEAGHENIVRFFLERGADVNIQDKNGKTILCIAVEKQSETIVDLILSFSPDANNEGNKNTLKTAALGYWDTCTSGKIIGSLLQYGFKAHLKVDDAKDVEVLHAAVKKGYFQLVERMLKSCQDVVSLINATGSEGRTSLHVASEKEREDMVELLISLGADVNALTSCSSKRMSTKGRSPLFYSVMNKNISITKLLLKNKAETKGCLLIAVDYENPEIVELLLQHGVDPNTRDKREFCPVSRNRLEKVNSDKILCKWGVDVEGENRAGESVLKAAICTGNTKIVELLLKYGADVNEAAGVDTDNNGPVLRTSLMVAVATGNTDITTVLLDKGAAVNVALMPKEITALHMAVYLKRTNVVDVLLRQPDIDLDCKDCENRTPLHYSVDHGDVEIALTLLKRGADVNCKDHLGKTPLHYAVDEGDGAKPVLATYDGVDILEALLRSGADPNARDAVHGFTPLHYWAANKKAESNIFYCLLKYGADIDSRSKTEETPLCVAVKNLYKDKVSVLLKSGADVNIEYVKRNEDRRSVVWSTPLQEAGWEYDRYDRDSWDEFVEHDGDTNWLTIADLLCRHVIMLDSAKFYVNARDMHLLDSCCVPALDKYRKKCEEELSLIKQTRVVGNPKVSFYDFLTKSPNKLASLLRRENMVEIISSSAQFRKDLGSFVIYGDLINNRIKMALNRGNLLKSAISCFGKMFSIPDLCVDTITLYMSNIALDNFVKACDAKCRTDTLM